MNRAKYQCADGRNILKKSFERRETQGKTMTIAKNLNGTQLTIALEGRLDTAIAPELEAELKASLDSADSLIIDLDKLEYISSAGLRVLLSAQKIMSKKGGMKVTHVNEIVKKSFICCLFIRFHQGFHPS